MATAASNETVAEVPDATQANSERTPTTPRPITVAGEGLSQVVNHDELSISTPTSHAHIEPIDQLPLASGLDILQTKDAAGTNQTSLKRDGSQLSTSPRQISDGQDVEMADGGDDVDEEEDDSDNDSVTSDSQRPSKKKKGQRFFCTDWPPCQLSFTRSEHLARHIRKHTGERPFQCHCSRRFSRLDNLRQHAQTVHLNEDIPGDSLAATSTRFQRQIRTDRVRPSNNRSRASTISSSGGHSRGHSRNLSSSSIASTASTVSLVEDTRRRPQPLAMANDPSSRAQMSLETYNTMAPGPGQPQYVYYNQSPFSTPTSAAFSTGPGSPPFQSGMNSPMSTISRSSFYNGARQTRRLSVPSGPGPFASPNGNTYSPPMYFTPMPEGNPAAFAQNTGMLVSPNGSTVSYGRRDSEVELEMRRRTWHPSTYNNNYMQRAPTSGLSYQQTPDDQRPAASNQLAASQKTRLPGIESFDHAPRAGSRQSSESMAVDSSPRPPSSGRPSDAGLHQNLTRLDIAAANAPPDGQYQAVQPQQIAPQAYMGPQPATVAPQHVQPAPPSMSEAPVTPKRNKRQGWYGGPVNGPVTPLSAGRAQQATTRRSPEDSGSSDGVPTPGTSQGVEFHPVIMNPNGMMEPFPAGTVPTDEQKSYPYLASQQAQTYALQAGHDPQLAVNYSQPANNDMGRLEALVAVATSENRAVERS